MSKESSVGVSRKTKDLLKAVCFYRNLKSQEEVILEAVEKTYPKEVRKFKRKG